MNSGRLANVHLVSCYFNVWHFNGGLNKPYVRLRKPIYAAFYKLCVKTTQWRLRERSMIETKATFLPTFLLLLLPLSECNAIKG